MPVMVPPNGGEAQYGATGRRAAGRLPVWSPEAGALRV